MDGDAEGRSPRARPNAVTAAVLWLWCGCGVAVVRLCCGCGARVAVVLRAVMCPQSVSVEREP